MVTLQNKPPKVILSENPAVLRMTSNLTEVENHHITVEVSWASGGLIGTDVLYPADGESVETNISEYLQSGFSRLAPTAHFTLPDSSATWSAVPDLIKKYTVYINDGSGDPPTYQSVILTNRFVLPGRIPLWIKNKFYSQYESVWNWIYGNNPFLTFAPKTRFTKPSQIQKLYWQYNYVPEVGWTLSLRINLRFSDGTSATWIKENFYGPLTQYSIYQFHVGYNSLGIPAKVAADYPGKEVVSYSITVMRDVWPVSEVREYILNYKPTLGSRELAFRNSLGTFDTILLKGISSMDMDFTPENVNVHGTSSGKALTRTLRTEVSATVKASTGLITAEEQLYIAELLDSREVYEIVNNKLYPVVITTQSKQLSRDRADLRAVTIEFEPVSNYFEENGD